MLTSMPLDPLDFADMQARADFVHDGEDRLVAVNDIGSRRAPRVLVIRTAAGTLTRFRADAPAELVHDVESFAKGLPPLDVEAAGDGGTIHALRDLVARHVTVEEAWAGPAFTFPLPFFPSIGAMQIYPANAHLLHPDLVSWAPEIRQRRPCFVVVREGQAIAICCSSRTSPLAAEAGVETAPAFRGQGAAGLAVTAWAAAIREAGKVPIYSTSWENAASRAVAAKLELELVAEDLHVS